MQASSGKDRNWWKSIDPFTVDPITLEPVRDFSIEPFQLDKTLFDGEMLAHYLISTAIFENPATREKITREDCLRLDEHLRINKVKTNKTKVVEAYDLLQNVSGQSKREQSDAMRREATLLFQHLFTFRSRRNELRQRNNFQQRRRQQNNRPSTRTQNNNSVVGLQIIDDDDESNFYPEGQFSYFDLDRDFPELFPVGNVQNNQEIGEYSNDGPTLPSKRTADETNARLITPKPRGGSQIANNLSRSRLTQLGRSNANDIDDDDYKPSERLDNPTSGDSDQEDSSNESEQFQKLFANLKRATPAGTDSNQTQASTMEVEEEEEEGDVPLFDEKLMKNKSLSTGPMKSSTPSRLEKSETQQTSISTKEDEIMDAEKQRIAAENEIRAMQRSTRNQTKKKQYSKPPTALPPRTSILNVVAPSTSEPIQRPSTEQPQQSTVNAPLTENASTKSTRRIFAVNPINRKGPCLASIVATIILAGAFFVALLVFSEEKAQHLFG